MKNLLVFFKKSLFAPCLPLLTAAAFAQSANDGFDPNVSGPVNALALQADGKILIGGAFRTVDGMPRSAIARLNVDGRVDAMFNPGTSFAPCSGCSSVGSLLVQPDGTILVAGTFDTLGGQRRDGLGRLNPDGSVDSGLNVTIIGGVNVLALQADGRILVGGKFGAVGGQPRQGLARLNLDGSVDSLSVFGNNSVLHALVVQPDGKILVAGSFSALGGVPRQNIGRLNPDGTVDTAFNPRANNSVTDLALQADGKILLSGYFTMLGAQTRGGFGRLYPDGSVDLAFNPDASGGDFGAGTSLNALAVQADGKILVGGNFSTLGGATRLSIGRLNPDGSVDGSFDPGTDVIVNSLAVQADGKILVGGSFTNLAGQPRHRLGRLYPDGSLDTTLNPPADNQVRCFALQGDGQIVAGGAFTSLAGESRMRLARFTAGGILDGSFNLYINNVVNSLAIQPDGKIVVAGFFSSLAGRPTERIGRLNYDGSLDTNFHAGAQSTVSSLALQTDGKILAGGDLPLIVRLNADGTPDGTVWQTGGFFGGNSVVSLVVQPDGKILMGGFFTLFAEPTFTNLCRWNPDGTLDKTFHPGVGDPPYGAVLSLALQADGRILVGGDFTTLAGRSQMSIGRLNPDGSPDTNFTAGADDLVASVVVQTDGKILLGGSFTMLNGTNCNHIGRLNPDGSLDTTFNPGADDFVAALAVQADGKILVGGDFSTLGGEPRSRLGRLTSGSAALQTLGLSSNGLTATWSRSGSGPEVEQVTFERSTDGVSYVPLGAATRVSGGWQLSGLLLPVGERLCLRARGWAAGGYGSASRGIIESVAQFYRIAPPTLFGSSVSGNGAFQFVFSNIGGHSFTVLATTNVDAPTPTWQTLGAPVPAGGGLYQFTDPAATNHARRFYQLRSP